MKSSFYNVFFPYNSKMIGYNSLSDKFLILDPLQEKLFNASIQESCIDKLKNIDSKLYNTLEEEGFIIDDNKNELERIRNISNSHDFSKDKYDLIINSTMNCNFKCWYCFESHIKNSKISKETLISIENHIDKVLKQQFNNLKYFHLSWFGGEPLLYYKKIILPLLKSVYPKMKKNNILFYSTFTSNGYLITEQMVKEFKKFGVSNLQITLDGNKERHNKVRYVSKSKGSYDKIIENIILCLNKGVNITVRINISKETLNGVEEIAENFTHLTPYEKKHLNFSIHKVWQEKDIHDDISKVVMYFRNKNFSVNYIGDNRGGIQSSCYADHKNQATINYNGDIYKCTARDFNSDNKEGVLNDNGEINWDKSKLKKRLKDSRFNNAPCLDCKILPICNGGCSQVRMENLDKEYCVYNFDSQKKMRLVKERFYSRLHNNPKRIQL